MALTVARTMDVSMGEWASTPDQQPSAANATWPSADTSNNGSRGGAALEASMAPSTATFFGTDSHQQQQQHSPTRSPVPLQRADTPCPAADRRASYVLLPACAGAGRHIELGTGTTVVGRCKSSGIRDHHVSRRHVEVTVPEEGKSGSEGCCRIKYIGRNCRVVLVGGILLKAEQEVAAGPGTKVILNFNNKGLPRYAYTLVPANNLPALASTMAAGRRAAAGTSCRWRLPGLPAPPPRHEIGAVDRPQRDAHLLKHPLGMKQKQRPGRFRKEAQDKLQKERDEIFSRFADLKFI